MLVDDITLKLEAGAGGRGAVAFNKVPLMLGPVGGDGGRGGSIYFEGVADIDALRTYASRKVIRAQDGGNGRGQFVDGKTGADMVIKVPTGTRVTNIETGFSREIERVGERILAAGGGDGGRGNFKFRSSTNTSPQEYEEGKSGDIVTYHIELLLIADVGLVGLPNAGKSSLLNALTAAHSRVGAYAFTTLEAHLGSFFGCIIADIPGLIEGAAEGKGLGVKFLKHVERTKTLFHLVSAESDDPVHDYRTVREELKKYGHGLTEKEEHVFLTKCDAVTAEELKAHLAKLKKAKIHATPITILDDASLEPVKKIITTIRDSK